MSSKNKTLSIVVPFYNEEKFIGQVLKKIVQADSLGLKKEIVMVNDGSTDNTLRNLKSQIIQFQKLSLEKSKFVLINNKKNSGKGAAIKDGFLKSTGDIVLVQDADLEYSPEDYPDLLQPFLKYNADVVYGSRFATQRPRRILYYWHFIANMILTTFSNMMTNLNLTDMETGYKVFRGDLIRKIAKKLESKRFGFEPEITARLSKIKNIQFYEVGISYKGRTYEEGKKIGFKDAVKAVWEIIKYNILTS